MHGSSVRLTLFLVTEAQGCQAQSQAMLVKRKQGQSVKAAHLQSEVGTKHGSCEL